MTKKEVLTKEYHIRVWDGRKEALKPVQGEPVVVKGAEKADLFLHYDDQYKNWVVSSGVSGMFVGKGRTRKDAIADVSQKGKPQAIIRYLKQWQEDKLWHSPADGLEWSEPKDKLEKIAAEFRKHYGEKVRVWGGGGAPPSVATLVRVEMHPTILKGKDGYTLKAFVKDADSKILPTEKSGDWDFWLGSWQIAVKGESRESEAEPITIDPDDSDIEVWKPKRKPRKPGKLVLLVKKREKPETSLGGMK